jgi:hypothetical protein
MTWLLSENHVEAHMGCEQVLELRQVMRDNKTHKKVVSDQQEYAGVSDSHRPPKNAD